MTEQIVFEQPKVPAKTGQVFYDKDLPTALEQAKEYVGKEGNVATFPEIAQARIIAPPDSYVWNNWFTTTTGEYKGLSKKGKPVYVVAHGAGPLAEPGRIRRAFKEGLTRGAAKLTQDEFYALLDQEDGENIIVLDFDQVKKIKSDVISVRSARNNDLVRARLGKHIDAYLDKHQEFCGKKIANFHDCDGLDLNVAQGRLLSAGCDVFYFDTGFRFRENLRGFDGLGCHGRFVGIVNPCLEQMLKYSAGFVPDHSQDEFRKGLKNLFK